MLRLAAALIGGCLVAFVLAGSGPASADDKSPSNEDIMKKLHGKNGSHKLINKALDAGPDWPQPPCPTTVPGTRNGCVSYHTCKC